MSKSTTVRATAAAAALLATSGVTTATRAAATPVAAGPPAVRAFAPAHTGTDLAGLAERAGSLDGSSHRSGDRHRR